MLGFRPGGRAPFVQLLESRQLLCGDGLSVAAAPPASAPADVKAIVMKPIVNGQTVFGSSAVGVKLKFKRTKTYGGNGLFGAVYEGGTFIDEKGKAGTYTLYLVPKVVSSPLPQFLDLTFKKAGISRRYYLTFTPASKRLNTGLNGKTVTFTTAAKGTSAKGTIVSTFLPTVYLKY